MTAPSPKLSPAEIDRLKAHRHASLADSGPFWELAREVCKEYGVKVTDLSAPTRLTDDVCMARDMVCYLAKGRGWKPEQVGQWLRRDGSTVRHSIKKLTDQLGHPPQS